MHSRIVTGGSRTKKQAADFEALIPGGEGRTKRPRCHARTELPCAVRRWPRSARRSSSSTRRRSRTSQKVTDVDKRIAGLEERTRTFTEIDARIQALLGDRGSKLSRRRRAWWLLAVIYRSTDSPSSTSRRGCSRPRQALMPSSESRPPWRRPRTALRKTQGEVKSTIEAAAGGQGRARSGPRYRWPSIAGLRAAARRVQRSARGFRRGRGVGQGTGAETRPADAAPGAEQDDRREACPASTP